MSNDYNFDETLEKNLKFKPKLIEKTQSGTNALIQKLRQRSSSRDLNQTKKNKIDYKLPRSLSVSRSVNCSIEHVQYNPTNESPISMTLSQSVPELKFNHNLVVSQIYNIKMFFYIKKKLILFK